MKTWNKLNNQEKIIKEYQIGAERIYSQLRDRTMSPSEARKPIANAYELFVEDFTEFGKTENEIKTIWENEIMRIIRQDPAFEN